MRSRNMQQLTDQVRGRWPGVVVYGIGNRAHQSEPSDHNEDDTPGSRPEQTDADTIPEHRAIDVMLGPHFTYNDAWTLVSELINLAGNRRRLRYVIFDRNIWRARADWERQVYTGPDKHTDHVHVSGDVADDDNTRPWADRQVGGQAPPVEEDDDMQKPILCNLRGRASVWVKEEGRQLRGLSSPWQLAAYQAMGAVTLPPAPTANDIIAVLGAIEGRDPSETRVIIENAG